MQPAFWNSSADIGPLEFSKSLLALFPKILKTDSHLITGSEFGLANSKVKRIA